MKKNRRMLILTSSFTAFQCGQRKKGRKGRGGKGCGLIASKKLLPGLPVKQI